MILESVNGCTCNSITIDGIETCNLSIDKLKDTIKVLVNRETDFGILQSILIDFIESDGKSKNLGICEECGDPITKYTLKIQ